MAIFLENKGKRYYSHISRAFLKGGLGYLVAFFHWWYYSVLSAFSKYIADFGLILVEY